jgi:serine phosphatase RsbU (regulator of sigma subunit)/tetratricopeptide (TPR) repeat protein
MKGRFNKIFILLVYLFFYLINTSQASTNIDSLLKVAKKSTYSKKPLLYLEIAQAYLQLKNYEESINYLNRIIKLNEGNENNEVTMKAYYSLGDNYIWKAEFEKGFQFLNKSLSIAEKIDDKYYPLDIYLLFAYGYRDMMNYDESIIYTDKAIELAAGHENKTMSDIYYVRGCNYSRKGNVDKALGDFTLALNIAKSIKYKSGQTRILNDLAVTYKIKGNYLKAIEYFQENLKTQESQGDSAGMAMTLGNIGNVYYFYNLMSKAIEYYEKSIVIYENLKNESKVGNLLYNIGTVYEKLNDNNKALEYLKKSFTFFKRLNFKSGIAQVQSEMGTLYARGGNFEMALKVQEEALAIYKEIGENINTAYTLRDMAETYNKANIYNTALAYYKQSLELEKQTGMKKEMLDNYKDIAGVYSKMNDFKSAYLNIQLYSNLKDSILSEENLKIIKELEAKYENDKKENEIKLQKSEISKKDIEAKRRNFVNKSLAVFVVFILAFAFLLYWQFNEKRKANILLAEQNDEIKKQRDQIYQQKKEITDSIHYASRIQQAVLPSTRLIEDLGLQYFILYKPRDIVSGDFYWINQKENKILIAAADCTGHGVPGAFMSMLGMALLNEIVVTGEFQSPGEILDKLRVLIIKSLHQSGKLEEAKDGMDISLCMIDKEKDILQYAGAFNPLYLIRKGELQEANADHMPVGFHDKLDVPFSNTEIKLQKDDTLYIFSDGYVDQFGGESGKKFMAKKFKQLLLGMQNLSMDQQKEHLDKTIIDWRGELDQVDDIMVIGLRV